MQNPDPGGAKDSSHLPCDSYTPDSYTPQNAGVCTSCFKVALQGARTRSRRWWEGRRAAPITAEVINALLARVVQGAAAGARRLVDDVGLGHHRDGKGRNFHQSERERQDQEMRVCHGERRQKMKRKGPILFGAPFSDSSLLPLGRKNI